VGEEGVFTSSTPSNKEPEIFSPASHSVETLPWFVDNVINFPYHSNDANYRNLYDRLQKLFDAFTKCEVDPRPSPLHRKHYGYVKRGLNSSLSLQMQNRQEE
jgi:hypothetical protein